MIVTNFSLLLISSEAADTFSYVDSNLQSLLLHGMLNELKGGALALVCYYSGFLYVSTTFALVLKLSLRRGRLSLSPQPRPRALSSMRSKAPPFRCSKEHTPVGGLCGGALVSVGTGEA